MLKPVVKHDFCFENTLVHNCVQYFSLYSWDLPLNMKLKQVKTLVFPYFNYCDVVKSDLTVELSDSLQSAQNYCIWFIFGLRRITHVSPFFEQLSVLKLSELWQNRILYTLQTISKTRSPPYLSETILFLKSVSEIIYMVHFFCLYLHTVLPHMSSLLLLRRVIYADGWCYSGWTGGNDTAYSLRPPGAGAYHV